MSKSASQSQERYGQFGDRTTVGEMVVVQVDDGIHNVANYEHGKDEVHEHTYTVSSLNGCTCPDAKYRPDTLCKHEEAVLDAKTATETAENDTSGVTGPHVATDATGDSYQFWRCENCGTESTDSRLSDGCWEC